MTPLISENGVGSSRLCTLPQKWGMTKTAAEWETTINPGWALRTSGLMEWFFCPENLEIVFSVLRAVLTVRAFLHWFELYFLIFFGGCILHFTVEFHSHLLPHIYIYSPP
jgi:hypothetical protein